MEEEDFSSESEFSTSTEEEEDQAAAEQVPSQVRNLTSKFERVVRFKEEMPVNRTPTKSEPNATSTSAAADRGEGGAVRRGSLQDPSSVAESSGDPPPQGGATGSEPSKKDAAPRQLAGLATQAADQIKALKTQRANERRAATNTLKKLESFIHPPEEIVVSLGTLKEVKRLLSEYQAQMDSAVDTNEQMLEVYRKWASGHEDTYALIEWGVLNKQEAKDIEQSVHRFVFDTSDEMVARSALDGRLDGAAEAQVGGGPQLEELKAEIKKQAAAEYRLEVQRASAEAATKAVAEALTSRPSVPSTAAVDPTVNVVLPQKDRIPKFGGNTADMEFLRWIKLWQTTFAPSGDQQGQKVDLLSCMLPGSEAYTIVEQVPMVGNSYDVAIDALYKVFGDEADYKSRMKIRVMELSPPHVLSVDTLTSFSQKVDGLVTTLNEVSVAMDPETIITEWMKKADTRLQIRLAAYMRREPGAGSQFGAFMAFLAEQVTFHRRIERWRKPETGEQPAPTKTVAAAAAVLGASGAGGAGAAGAGASRSDHCPLCENSTHPLWKCSSFKKMKPEARCEFRAKKNWCKICLAGSHPVSECGFKAFKGCNQCRSTRHNSLLCTAKSREENMQRNQEKRAKVAAAKVGAGAGASSAPAAPAGGASTGPSTSAPAVDLDPAIVQAITRAVMAAGSATGTTAKKE